MYRINRIQVSTAHLPEVGGAEFIFQKLVWFLVCSLSSTVHTSQYKKIPKILYWAKNFLTSSSTLRTQTPDNCVIFDKYYDREYGPSGYSV